MLRHSLSPSIKVSRSVLNPRLSTAVTGSIRSISTSPKLPRQSPATRPSHSLPRVSMSTYKHSEACCKIPPVITEGYKTKGDYVDLNGMRSYVTGPADAHTAIFVFYDIFGFKDQILQGADILAYSDHEHPYLVIMPGFFGEEPADISWYPPDTDEKQKKLGEWFGRNGPPAHLPRVQPTMRDAEQKYPSIKTWGMIGYCWGGKCVSLIAGKPNSAFKAGVQTSPAMVSPEDAEKVTIPMCMLASKEEPPEDVKKYEQNLKVKKHVETFDTQLHGFMSARGDLKDESVKKEYERGYKIALQFFHDNL